MRKFIVSVGLGVSAGVVDLVPMIIQNLEVKACISAFAQWVVLGIFINYIDLGVRSWIKGLLIAEMAVIPILILVSSEGYTTIIPILLMTALLGSLVGYFGSKLSHEK
jgi:hypothetical protein